MTKVCTDCHGTGRSRTVWTQEHRFADCEACEGKGYTRELRRMTAEDVRRIVEHKPTWAAVKHLESLSGGEKS